MTKDVAGVGKSVGMWGEMREGVEKCWVRCGNWESVLGCKGR